MRDLFNSDNPVMRLLANFFNLMLLNWLFLISCLPIFTIGTATSAMYSVIFQILDGEDPSIISAYAKSFKSNFKQATILWIPLLLAGIFWGTDLYVVYQIIDKQYQFLQFPIWIFIFVTISLIIYAFPLLGRYQCSNKQLLKNALLLSLANFPTTLFFVVIHIGIGYIASASANNLVLVGSLSLFFGYSMIATLFTLFLNRIFERCNPAEESKSPD